MALYYTERIFKKISRIKLRISKKPKKIILSFSTEQAPYIISQPLHQSQKIMTESDTEVRVELFVYITHELKMTILSYGENVQVISPKVLKEQIKEIIKKMQILYQ